MENSPLHVCRLQPARGELMPDTPRSTRIRMLPRTERIDEFHLAFGTETAFTAVDTETGCSVKTQILNPLDLDR
jgi:hypothetical protein